MSDPSPDKAYVVLSSYLDTLVDMADRGMLAPAVAEALELALAEPRLNFEQEMSLWKRVEAGLFAEELLNAGKQRDPNVISDFEYIAADGQAAAAYLLVCFDFLAVAAAIRSVSSSDDLVKRLELNRGILVNAAERFDYTSNLSFALSASEALSIT